MENIQGGKRTASQCFFSTQMGTKKYPAENLGTKKPAEILDAKKYPTRFSVPKSNKIKGKIKRERAKTPNFRACGGQKG